MIAATDPTSVSLRLRTLLSNLLLLEPERVKPESLLVDDLGLDSLGFIELAFGVEEKFGVEFPDAKSDGQLLALSVPEGLRRIEAMPGTITLFEYVKEAAVRAKLLELTVGELAASLAVAVPTGVAPATPLAAMSALDLVRVAQPTAAAELGRAGERRAEEALAALGSGRILGADARDRVFEAVTIGGLACAVGGPVPGGLDPDGNLMDLPLVQLFRFPTVAILSRYVEHLLAVGQGPTG